MTGLNVFVILSVVLTLTLCYAEDDGKGTPHIDSLPTKQPLYPVVSNLWTLMEAANQKPSPSMTIPPLIQSLSWNPDKPPKMNSEIQRTLTLLKQGEEEIVLKEEYKDIILVIGMTGAGKSTLTQWVAGYDDKLLSKEADNSGSYIIINDKVSNNTLKSQTIFPELFLDVETNTPYYDFPGFSDTRSTANDIATSYFIKKVIDHVDKIKFLVCVNYPSVKKGVDRQDFLRLVQHITELIKDIDKIKDSVTIVATKVNNLYKKSKGDLILVPDEEIIQGIAIFLGEVKKDLEERVKQDAKKTNMYVSAIKFVDALLTKKDNLYDRINIFRQPDQEGPLSEIHSLVEGKVRIRNSINKSVYTIKDNKDFGHTISDRSKLVINDLANEINNEILLNLENIADDMNLHYQDLAENDENVIKSMEYYSINDIQYDNTKKIPYKEELEVAYKEISKLADEIRGINTSEDLLTKINDTMLDLHLYTSSNFISSIVTQNKFLEFLEELSDKRFTTHFNSLAWASPFLKVATNIAESRTKIYRVAQDIINELEYKINSDVARSSEAMKKYFADKEESIQDIRYLYDIARTGFEKLREVTDQEFLTAAACSQQVGFIDIGPSKYILSNITAYGNNIDYLRNMVNTKNSEFTCVKGLDYATKYLDIANRWYQFLNLLYDKLSDYIIQRDTNTCKALSERISQRDIGKIINETDMYKFLENCYDNTFNIEYDAIKDVRLDRYKFRNLQGVLQHTLHNQLRHECSNDKIIFTGAFVKLSDISLSSCTKPVKFVEVFALDKIFIDENFDSGTGNVQMTIIAPTWDIRGNHVISLNGQKGNDINPESAKNAVGPGARGQDGKPGLPGSCGGNLLAIGANYVNNQNLILSAKGGTGGTGQAGGRGADGEDGQNPGIVPQDTSNFKKEHCSDEYKIAILCNGTWNGYPFSSRELFPGSLASSIAIYDVFSQGTKGGDGGDGGTGGLGGNPGKIVAISLNGDTKPRIETAEGETGIKGTGGKFGLGGRERTTSVTIKRENLISITYEMKTYFSDSARNSSGKLGDSGSNDKNIVKPDNSPQWYHPDHTLNKYKSILIENMNGIREIILDNFLHNLNNYEQLHEFYDASGFINELYVLEETFNKKSKVIKFTPMYKSLLNRIDFYIEKVRGDSRYVSVLEYIRLATSSRLYNINNDLDNYLVIDTKEYFNYVERHIEEYKQALKEVKVSTYKQQYKNSFINDIVEANKLIQETILPDLNKIYKNVDDNIELLIKIIIEEQENASKDIDKLVARQNELEKQFLISTVLGSIKFSTQMLSFAGPAGAVGAGMAGTAVDAAENTLLDDKHSVIFKSAQMSMTNLTNYFKHEQDLMKKSLDSMKKQLEQEAINKNKEDLDEILAKIKPLEDKINEPRNMYYHEKKVVTKDQLKKYVEELNVKKDAIKKEIDESVNNKEREQKAKADEKRVNNKINAVAKIQKSIALAEMGYNLYNKIASYPKQIAAAGNAMVKVYDKIDELKKYEHVIYDKMIPLRDNFENTLNTLDKDAANKSHAVLDVTKYQIQTNIIEFQKQMEFMVQSSNSVIKSELMACIEKLKFAMLMITQLYDRIQDYQGKARFADYIAALNSEGKVTDNDEWNRQIEDLELLTKSNLVLQEYDKATNAFKQFMLPFAGLYLENYALSPKVGAKNVSVLIQDAAKRLTFLRDELTKDATVIKKSPYSIFPNIRFDNEITDRQQGPFYTWKGNEYKEKIRKLLLGEEVVLKADIMKGINKNAVKFREIGINFIIGDNDMQKQLRTDMSQFIVEMTHYGDSIYRCDHKYLKINHDPIVMKHSVEKAKDKNHYYYLDKTATLIRNNPAMCSPYATWKVKLLDKDGNKDFKILEKYIGSVEEIALVGWGQYIDLGLDVCNDSIKNYYEIDETLSDVY